MRKLMLTLVTTLIAAVASAQTEGIADFKMTSGESMQGTGRMYFAKGGYRSDWSMDVSGSTRRTERPPGRSCR